MAAQIQAVAPINTQAAAVTTARNILGSIVSGTQTTVSSGISRVTSTESGGILLKSVYYALIFLFVIFIILTIVNYTVTPIFSFAPGQPGIIPVPGGATDDDLAWNTLFPNDSDYHPRPGDHNAANAFKRDITFSVDIYVKNLVAVPVHKRILFYRGATTLVVSGSSSIWNNYEPVAINNSIVATDSIRRHLQQNTLPVSCVGYIDEQSRLLVDFFSTNRTPLTLGPFENVPVGTPFRITVTVQEKMLELYINSRLAKSLRVPSGFGNPVAGNEAIFPGPSSFRISSIATEQTCGTTASSTQNGIYLLNLHIWPRVLSVPEIYQMIPVLPTAQEFEAIKGTAGEPIGPGQVATTATGAPIKTQQCKNPSYNPLKDIDTKSAIIIVAAIGAVVILFRSPSSNS